MRSKLLLVFAVFLLVVYSVRLNAADQTSQTGSKVFDNQDVLNLVQAGIDASVVVAKIKQAPEVSFKLGADDLIQMKQAGASSEILTAMIERGANQLHEASKAPAALPNFGFGPNLTGTVILSSAGGQVEIQAQNGSYYTKRLTRFFSYPGVHAKPRSSDRRPNVLVRSDFDPRSHYFVVKLSSDESLNVRLLKIKGNLQPDEDVVLQSSTSETKDDVWSITPTAPLAPGEYGLFDGYRLFAFGVD